MTPKCKWDREAEVYLRDGEPCKVDAYGDPTYHCRARRHGYHIAKGELTCARCLADTRATIRRIVELAPLAATRALGSGVDSEAANLAGPAADYRVFSARRVLDRLWIMTHIPERHMERAMRNLLEDDDELHPYSVLTRWHLMLAEDYAHPLPDVMTVSDSGAYLDRVLHRVAQDPEQDFPLLMREMRKCLAHIEAVLQNDMRPERGAPCPDCRDEGIVLRLSRQYPHWCDDPDCERMHYSTVLDHETLEDVPDTAADEWTCPRGHRRSHEDYQRWIEERTAG